MKKELYSKPKAVTAVYFDGSNLTEVLEIAPKAIQENIELPLTKVDVFKTNGDMYYTMTQVRVILDGDPTNKYDNIVYPGQWVIVKTYSKTRFHKNDSPLEVWYEIVDNLDDYIETSKVVINA
jgi:hypothetical protein